MQRERNGHGLISGDSGEWLVTVEPLFDRSGTRTSKYGLHPMKVCRRTVSDAYLDVSARRSIRNLRTYTTFSKAS